MIRRSSVTVIVPFRLWQIPGSAIPEPQMIQSASFSAWARFDPIEGGLADVALVTGNRRRPVRERGLPGLGPGGRPGLEVGPRGSATCHALSPLHEAKEAWPSRSFDGCDQGLM